MRDTWTRIDARDNHFDLALQVVRDAYTRIAREVITSMRVSRAR